MNFDVDVPKIPESNMRIRFDDIDLYLELNTLLSGAATYEINLHSSISPIGIKVGPMIQIGVVAGVDLILSVEKNGNIDISTGFHVKIEDGVTLNIALFDDKISEMIL